jgi:hypothetical protein
MTLFPRSGLAVAALAALSLAFLYPLSSGEVPDFLRQGHFGGWFVAATILIAALAAIFRAPPGPAELWLGLATAISALYLLSLLGALGAAPAPGYWALAAAAILVALQLSLRLAVLKPRPGWPRLGRAVLLLLILAATGLLTWEVVVSGMGFADTVPTPSALLARLRASPATSAGPAPELSVPAP